MQPSNSTQLLEEFNDYFQVEQAVSVNLVPYTQALPAPEQFYQRVPDAFKMASELSSLNSSSSRALANLKELPPELIQYLQLQTKKIDSMMHYVLRNQEDASQRFLTFSFGGAGLRVWFDSPETIGQLFETKLFLEHGAGAVYAISELIDCEPYADDTSNTQENTGSSRFLGRLLFRRILEDDQDLVVRASLHEQSRQLKRKAEARQALNRPSETQ